MGKQSRKLSNQSVYKYTDSYYLRYLQNNEFTNLLCVDYLSTQLEDYVEYYICLNSLSIVIKRGLQFFNVFTLYLIKSYILVQIQHTIVGCQKNLYVFLNEKYTIPPAIKILFIFTIYQNICFQLIMKSSKQILIYYTFQLEDTNEYNISRLKQNYEQLSDIKIKNVITNFPFDVFSGHYHFRFKSQFQEGNQKIVGWIDISNLNSKVPFFKDAIYVKVLKLKSNSHNKLFSRQKLYTVFPAQRTNLIKKQSQKLLSHPKIKNNDHSHSVTPNHISKQVSPKHNNNQQDILIFQDSSSIPNKPQIIKPKVIPPKIQQTSKDQNNIPNDLDFSKPPSQKGFQQQTASQKAKRYRQNLKLQQKQKAQEALVRTEVDQKIQKWAYSSKIRKNFRTLLVTVQEVWDYGNWTSVTVADLLTDKDLRKYYNKAQLIFHPDKNRDKQARRKYLSKRIASQLSEAFKKI